MGLRAAGNQIGIGIKGGVNGVNNTAARGLLNAGHGTGKTVNERLKGKASVAEKLVIIVHSAKHLPPGHKKKPAAYLKLQVGKKGVKQKSRAATAGNNPNWNQTVTLAPITDFDEDLRIQVYDRRIFAEDDQLGKTLKIPLRDLIDAATTEQWYDIPATDEAPLKEGEKAAQVQLSLGLVGVQDE